ncbi:regucalcin-like [Diprion similis]|uniref:regucalcin-like n=1 Tax=Diprion similis TaxID=362088 RepID=UPI001EF9B5E9|nr:regucalcin-like [Diprion similis]
MQSLSTVIIFGRILLPFVTLASPDALSKPRDRECVQIPKVVTVEQVTEPVQHAEGPHWSHQHQTLYFVDIHVQRIYHLNTVTGKLTFAYIANGPVGFVIPVETSSNQFIAGSGTDLLFVKWDSETNSYNPQTELLCTVDRDRNGTRFNDAKCDSHGRLWAGTMGAENASGDIVPDQASLYRISSDLVPDRVIVPVSISNGLAWNHANNKFYYIDSPTQQIAAYDFDANTGIISNKRIAFDLDEHNISGLPDGMTIDTNDNLWIAVYGGKHILNVDPVEGRLLRAIEIPADRVTSLMFGGPSLDILYVTTSRYGLTDAEIEAQPRAGCVFAVKGLGVKGYPANTFTRYGTIS